MIKRLPAIFAWVFVCLGVGVWCIGWIAASVAGPVAVSMRSYSVWLMLAGFGCAKYVIDVQRLALPAARNWGWLYFWYVFLNLIVFIAPLIYYYFVASA